MTSKGPSHHAGPSSGHTGGLSQEEPLTSAVLPGREAVRGIRCSLLHGDAETATHLFPSNRSDLKLGTETKGTCSRSVYLTECQSQRRGRDVPSRSGSLLKWWQIRSGTGPNPNQEPGISSYRAPALGLLSAGFPGAVVGLWGGKGGTAPEVECWQAPASRTGPPCWLQSGPERASPEVTPLDASVLVHVWSERAVNARGFGDGRRTYVFLRVPLSR